MPSTAPLLHCAGRLARSSHSPAAPETLCPPGLTGASSPAAHPPLHLAASHTFFKVPFRHECLEKAVSEPCRATSEGPLLDSTHRTPPYSMTPR